MWASGLCVCKGKLREKGAELRSNPVYGQVQYPPSRLVTKQYFWHLVVGHTIYPFTEQGKGIPSCEQVSDLPIFLVTKNRTCQREWWNSGPLTRLVLVSCKKKHEICHSHGRYSLAKMASSCSQRSRLCWTAGRDCSMNFKWSRSCWKQNSVYKKSHISSPKRPIRASKILSNSSTW